MESLGKGVVIAGGKDNVTWSCLNGGKNVEGDLPNHCSLYNSICNGFFKG